MNDLSQTVAAGLIQSYRDSARRVRELARPLTEEQFWVRPYAYGNSFGTLVVHLTGNLNYYIGAQVAGTGYVRDRDREFTDRRLGEKERVLAALDDAVAMVVGTLEQQTGPDWARAYQGTGSDAGDRFGIFLSCAVHFRHHVGQMMYLVRELERGA